MIDDGARAGLAAKAAEPQQTLHAQQEAGAADPADQNRDLHVTDIRPWGPEVVRRGGVRDTPR